MNKINKIEKNTGVYLIEAVSGSSYIIDFDNLIFRRNPNDESDWYGDLQRNIVKKISDFKECVAGGSLNIILNQDDDFRLPVRKIIAIS